jgi:glycosyltransferase involved in cell wall biosynthesis
MPPNPERPSLTIIILTYNEERRLPPCLDSLAGLEAPVFVVDSNSTDGTLDILNQRGLKWTQHPFGNYAQQRNWAQANNPFDTEWVLHLDADERLTPELVQWLNTDFARRSAETDGFLFSRRTVFLGRWIRHGGHYPAYHLRLFRSRLGRCEDKAYDQHFVVSGLSLTVPGADIIDTVTSNLEQFIASHNRWSSLEAAELAAREVKGEVNASLTGNAIERRRWLKTRVFQKAPPMLRAFAYFIYRYIFRLGFLDGFQGLVFHVLQGFWFRFLVDAKLYELRQTAADHPASTKAG